MDLFTKLHQFWLFLNSVLYNFGPFHYTFGYLKSDGNIGKMQPSREVSARVMINLDVTFLLIKDINI